MVSEFVDGWSFAQTLGEGAFGEVRLLINRNTGEEVAVKIVDLEKHPEARTLIRKEVCIHKLLVNQHIIRYYGQRTEANVEYIFLEYAAGGELFDKIEPDIGMDVWEAQKYFIQLLSGVEYLHSHGIAHRDLKPENLLLDVDDNLKISDFGLATCFRIKGKERLLERQCGTIPYVAPEVLGGRAYRAEPADIWSCGIILVAMLAGELPWDIPSPDCAEYGAWKNDKYLHLSPWRKLEPMALSLIRKILFHVPSTRYKKSQICAHRWYLKIHKKSVGFPSDITPNSAKRICSGIDISPPCHLEDVANLSVRMSLTQPEPRLDQETIPTGGMVEQRVPFSFSQPAHLEDLLLSSQVVTCTQTTSGQNTFQKLVRRMTRFFVSITCEEICKHLCEVLEKEACSWKIHTPNILTITWQDRRKMQLVFKAMILDMNGKTLVDFRLSKGCGLEFKRKFIKVKESLGNVVLKGPVMWPIAIATNSVP